LQFGSPVVPKTPEAWALHYVDNLDAKMEMMSAAYDTSRHLAPRIQERVWPLPGNLVQPLRHFPRPEPTPLQAQSDAAEPTSQSCSTVAGSG
jgi:3'-5' exoribonuclease